MIVCVACMKINTSIPNPSRDIESALRYEVRPACISDPDSRFTDGNNEAGPSLSYM